MKKKANRPPKPRKSRVLIIDDHAMVREGVAQIIEHTEDLSVCCSAPPRTKAWKRSAS